MLDLDRSPLASSHEKHLTPPCWSVECGIGDFDHDASSASPCQPFSACAAGSFVVQEGQALSDRVCTTCAPESYSDQANAMACTPMTTCGDNEYVASAGSETSDRSCQACPGSSTSTGPNAVMCEDECSLALGVLCHVFDQGYLKSSNPKITELFGTSVSLSGNTLAVGVPGDKSAATGINGDASDASAQSAGSVFVYTRDAMGTWAQQAYVKASNTEVSDEFGASVSLEGDTLAVGARGESSSSPGIDGDQTNNDAAGSGAVFVRKIAP